METVLLSSCTWQTVYQEAQRTWNSTAPAVYSARLLSLGCTLAAPCALQLWLVWSGLRAWPTTCLLVGFLDTSPPSCNSLQKWYPTVLFPSSLPSSTAPDCSEQKSVKQLRDQEDKAGWVLPYQEAQVRSACSEVGLYVNCIKPSVHQLYC